jgi:selenocysteine lyase/cysteine desulfurase
MNSREAFTKLEESVHTALEMYSNVHRGSGHNSMVSTALYEQARKIVLRYLGLNKSIYVVIFATAARAEIVKSKVKAGSIKCISSNEIGLPLGIYALAVKSRALPKGIPFQTGGGTTTLVSPGWVVWANAPDRFEAGTPAIINVIAFARALVLIGIYGKDAFLEMTADKMSLEEILYHDELGKLSGKELLEELRKTIIGHGLQVPTAYGDKSFINLDNAASTPAFNPVWNVVRNTWRQSGTLHQEIINEVRAICARALGAPLATYDLIFTSNTTEAINLAAESMGREAGPGSETVVVNTLFEHNSNDLPWRRIPYFSIIRLQMDTEGFVDLNELESILCAYNKDGQHGKKRVRLVAVSGASNVLGVFNNLEKISQIVHLYGARLLVDAAQLIAHRKIEIERCGIDYLAFSAHKAYAPFGTGVLLARKGLLNFSPAEMKMLQASGEENVTGIAALGKALMLLQRIGLDVIQNEEQHLTGYALRGLKQISGLQIFGIKDPDSPKFIQKGGVIVFSMKNIFANVLAKELAERSGIGIRYGCHCAHILIKHLVGVGPGLERFQYLIATLFSKVKFPGLARVSLGIGNSEEDIDTLIRGLNKISIQPKSPSNKDIQKKLDNFTKNAVWKVFSK